MGKHRIGVWGTLAVATALLVVACEGSSENPGGGTFDAGSTTFDAAVADTSAADTSPAPDAADEADAADAAKVLPEGLSDPIPYLSIDDSLFKGLTFASYYHFEDWEDGLVNTPGVTPSTTATGFGPIADSVDGDDGVIDGKCLKAGNLSCNSGFGPGVIDFTFDAAVLGALPTHVGIVWTDGQPLCDAVFEAYDAADVLIGTKTAAAVGDADNAGGAAEDRFFSVVHAAGVKKIVVKSSSGGVEVDHLQYGR